MADERLRSKKEIKLVFSNLKRKGITDDMMARLIDVLWRNKYSMRTSGFSTAGGPDCVIEFDDATRTFSIYPLDPEYETYNPRFSFYTWNYSTEYHQRYEQEDLILPDEEGLFVIYYDTDEDNRVHKLFYTKNPTYLELKDIYQTKVLVSFVYWDYTNQEATHFGNDRHGSEWNPQMHWMLHRTIKGQVDEGLTITDMLINEDGSLDTHAQFTVNSGTWWHDDFLLDIAAAGGSNTIQILYFSGVGNHYPRFTEQSGFGVYLSAGKLAYNRNADSIATVNSGNFVAYHIFATNEHAAATKKVITAMGQEQYNKLAECYAGITAELDTIYQHAPHQGMCHLGTILLEVNDAYTNSVKARIVGFWGGASEMHPPVTIEESSKKYLEIDEDQELSFIPEDLLADIQTIIENYYDDNVEGDINTSVNNAIESTFGGAKESFLIDNSDNASETQYSTWTVEQLNERVGEFKAVIMVRDKSTDTVYSLQNLLGFDYVDTANKVSKDNEMITDGTITLVLGIHATSNLLYATLTGMPTNFKRIHFCFERCVLGADDIGAKAAGTIVFTGTVDASAYVEAEAAGTIEITGQIGAAANVEAEAAGTIAITGSVDAESTGEGEAAGTIAITGSVDGEDGNAPAFEDINYGYYYNGPVLTDGRDIANTGWHWATEIELDGLASYLGVSTMWDVSSKLNLKTSGYNNNGTFNDFGNYHRMFGDLDNTTWVANIQTDSTIWNSPWLMWTLATHRGVSLRLVKDTTALTVDGEEGQYIGNDGKIYKTVYWGGIEIICQPLAETKYRNGNTITKATNSTEWNAATGAMICAYNYDDENV